ncbi:MAG TPA: carboxypeptidase-like regulatory domain-containing protein [Gemmatimonadaceae bacterium]|nr:carboxypeptidase-like regulatory domain-containing protein [Gemmatimonadaceae bacterium]
MSAVRAVSLAALAALIQTADAQATIVGTVFDSLRMGAPFKRATIVIPQLSRYVTSDDEGRFRIDSVPAGRYSITFLHPILDSLDVSAEVLPITIPAKGIVIARLATPSPTALVWLVCRAASDTFPAMMLGHVLDAHDSTGIADATVTASWSELVLGASSLERRTVRAVAQSRESGSYLLCGVPSTLRVEVTATVGDRSTGTLIFSPAGELVIHRDLRIARPPGVATVSGIVRDVRGLPAARAMVTASGPPLRALTDEAGRFSLRDVPSGTQLFEVRRVGSWPGSQLVDVPVSGARDISLALGPRAEAIGRAEQGASNPDDETGFEDRRNAGIGQFIWGSGLAKSRVKDISDLLLQAPMLFRGTTGKVKLVKMKGIANASCTPNYFLNGYPWRPGISGLAQIEVEQSLDLGILRGVEVYSSAAVPPIFDRKNGCGSVIIWTR